MLKNVTKAIQRDDTRHIYTGHLSGIGLDYHHRLIVSLRSDMQDGTLITWMCFYLFRKPERPSMESNSGISSFCYSQVALMLDSGRFNLQANRDKNPFHGWLKHPFQGCTNQIHTLIMVDSTMKFCMGSFYESTSYSIPNFSVFMYIHWPRFLQTGWSTVRWPITWRKKSYLSFESGFGFANYWPRFPLWGKLVKEV